jgi:hypothetical protein
MGSEGIAPPFLTSTLDGGELSASYPHCFTPGEITPGTHWIGGWVGPSWSECCEEQILPCQEYNPGHPAHSYTD